jgi:sucrose-6-phosphate hydrolase SacC (GH32 family)
VTCEYYVEATACVVVRCSLDMGGAGDGPDWGHWVSKDFTKWAQLPVAIWNDQYYDNSAIYTGSTTIVDGKPVMMYPGKCNCKGTNETGAPCCNDGAGGFT